MSFFSLMCGLVLNGFTHTVETQLTAGAARRGRRRASSLQLAAVRCSRACCVTTTAAHALQRRAGRPS